MPKNTSSKVTQRLDEIHDLMVQGYTDQKIRERMNISERNWFDTYKPKLIQRYREYHLNKHADELYHISKIAEDQLLDALTNAHDKARIDKSDASWGDLEIRILLFLFKFRRDGILSNTNDQVRRLVQQTREGEPIILPKSPESREDDGSDTPRTEAEPDKD